MYTRNLGGGEASYSLEQLRKIGHEKNFSRGESLFRDGDNADCLFLVLSGSVKVYIEEDGDEVVLAYLNSGDILGEVALNPATRLRSASARARADTTVCRISFDRFQKLASENHHLWLLIIQQMGQHLRNSTHRVKLLATMTAEQRILHMLRELCELPGTNKDGNGVEIRVTREELGSIAGCSREMAGRALRKLNNQGSIELRGHKIWIRNEAD